MHMAINMSKHILKHTVTIFIVEFINNVLADYLKIVSPESLNLVWGFLCFLVFMDSMTVYNDLQLMQSQHDDLIDRNRMLQEFYQHNKSMHIQTLNEHTGQINDLIRKLNKISKKIDNLSPPSSFHSSFSCAFDEQDPDYSSTIPVKKSKHALERKCS
jgi:gamma-glutamylcysteine synthetase